MPKLIPVSSPQFRTMLIRKLSNVIPSCDVEFVDGLERGIGFRLKDKRGRYRSNIIRIYRNGPTVLDRDRLIWSIRREGNPGQGLPKELTLA